jgi:threonine/homoserine/homoserine lactone efflux protein
MDLALVAAFALPALGLIMLPGPDQALITASALQGGRRGGLLTTVGGALGVVVHAAASAVGLSALLIASAGAFTVLKVVGAGYLLWLGVQTLRAARRSRRERPGPSRPDVVISAAPGTRGYVVRGFLSNALNPKVALFFVTFLPQYLSVSSGSPQAEALLLSVVFALLYLAWFGMLVAVVHRLGRWLQQPTVRSRIEAATGMLLVAFAIRLAVASR